MTPLYTLIYLYMFKNPLSVIASSFFIASYVFLLTIFIYEEQAKGTAFNKALPVKNSTVVAGYYLTLLLMLLYMLVWVLIVLKVYFAVIPTVPEVRVQDVLMALAMVLVVSSVQIPVILRFGALKTRIANLIILMGLLALAAIAGNELKDQLMEGSLLSVGMLLMASLIYILSAVISTSIYAKKEGD